MRITLGILSLSIFLSLGTPVFADDAVDYINEEISEWTTIANDNGYSILDTYSGIIGKEDVTIMFELTPGTYRFYSSGGLHVTDLDLFLNDSAGEITNDTLTDKIPIVVIMLEETTCVEARIAVWEFEEGYEEDYYCLLVTAENDGQMLTCSENWRL